MPNKNGYQPLGQDEPHIPEQQQQDAERRRRDHQEDDASTAGALTQGSHLQHQQQDQQDHVAVTLTKHSQSDTAIATDLAVDEPGNSCKDTPQSVAQDQQQQQQQQSSTSTVTTTTTITTTRTTTTAAVIQESTNLPSPSPSRPSAYATASTPTLPDATITSPASASSSSPSFQFPGFGTKHKSLLGLKDRLSSSSSNGNNHNNTSSNSSSTRLTGSRSYHSNGSRDMSASDLANIRPKQHPHTTLSGPRGIEKSQKREVLREIRPDPNLPEELLREQARSDAVFEDAIANNGHYPQEGLAGGGGSPAAPGSPGGHAGGGGGGERGTLLGSGDGLGLGIGLGGKANIPSRWSRPGRRQRRVPGSGLGPENDQRVILSVFSPVLVSVDGGLPVTPAPALTPDHAEPMTRERFVSIVDSVKDAIHSGIQPLRIAQGSSGSYFCRNLDGKIVGVFKPKNEEPYGQLNPKWAKWIHRNLFPCCFGRSCLIPNLGYISEAATSLVDRRLKLNIVPSTEVVWLSSSAFHYDYLDRRAAQLQKGPKPLPDKVGSFQLFLSGFKDANLFMRDHPWPVESTIPGGDANLKGKNSTWRRSIAESEHSHQDADGASVYGSITGSAYGGQTGAYGYGPDKPGFSWTPALQQQFREQFERMIILDYLIRNTDRGLDNWMIRYCEKEGISIVAGPPTGGQKGNLQTQQQDTAARRSSRVGDLLGMSSDPDSPQPSSPLSRHGVPVTPPGTPPRSSPFRAQSGMEPLQDHGVQENAGINKGECSARSGPPEANGAAGAVGSSATMESYYGPNHVHVAAIDNGLAFPFKHPDSWRSYPYGWLFLPRPLISQPFTKATRDHFLPLLSSPVWWRETIADLRRLFSIDSDFDQGMFDKQMAVMKGQGWNIVETLKNLEQGPMDLCRRVALVVWDEEMTLDHSFSPSMQAQSSTQTTNGGYDGQTYTSTQPKPMTMGAPMGSYSNYGSIMSAGDRLSNSKTLSTSSTAIGESTPFLKHDYSKNGSLPHMVIDMVDDGVTQPLRDSFRQVVSDGEYDFHDDDDDEAFSFDEDYDEFEDDVAEQPRGEGQSHLSASQTLAPVSRSGMVSIDMALSNPDVVRSSRRRQSHSEGGRSRRRQSVSGGGGGVVHTEQGASKIAGSISAESPALPNNNHRRSRTEQDDRTGVVRFDTPAAWSPNRTRGNTIDLGNTLSSLLLPSQKGDPQNPFESPEDHVADGGHVDKGNRALESEPERGRTFFSHGYGAISPSKDGGGGDDDGTGRASERPRWSERFRRGLSFDGHLLTVGTARRERQLRKQRQRDRELREKRVVLVERIEPVTKNLPYFKWW
ncbi:phosphatidylinositol 3 and 4-kinase-domain-containing protein [Dissophora ornata]|nr:phosphatidyl inositol kinase [Dissophora ornata]KAI8595327.1 phosphatidylinositol 3 and 4-kinase-domain-containing protein [Dissophora ornata]